MAALRIETPETRRWRNLLFTRLLFCPKHAVPVAKEKLLLQERHFQREIHFESEVL
jgi:hypothetical protein